MTHEQLKQEAIDAIQQLFGDTSVSQQQTLDSLREVLGEVQESIQTLIEDAGPNQLV